jgi:hypothetical protein
MKELEIGVQTTEDGLEYFGLDELNAELANGARVLRLDEGDILVLEDAEDDGEEVTVPEDEEGFLLAGFTLKVQLEDA